MKLKKKKYNLVIAKFIVYANIIMLIISNLSAQEVSINSVDESMNVIEISMEADLNSKYIYKGVVYSDQPVYQPGLTMSYGNFSAGVWSSFNFPKAGTTTEITELDFSISRSFSAGNLYVNNTASLYFFYGEDPYPATAEYILFASYPVGPLSAFSDLSIDIAEYAGAFAVTHGISFEKQFTEVLCLNTSLNMTWATGKYNLPTTGFDRTSIVHTGLDVSLTYYHNSDLYIKPHFQYNLIPDKRLHEYIGDHNYFFGVLTGFSF